MITVVGSAVVDSTALLPKLPGVGETVMGFKPLKISCGGKGGNQAAAACKAGADVYMVAKIGDDDYGHFILSEYKKMGINSDYIIVDPNEHTGCAPLMVDENTGKVYTVVIPLANLNMTVEDVDRAEDIIAQSDIVMLQLEISKEACLEAAKLASKHGAKVIFNPAPFSEFPEEILQYIDFATPNETEAGFWSGIEVKDDESAIAAAKAIKAKGVKNVIITLGSRGSLVYENDDDYTFIDSFEVKAVDSTGAGDGFNSGFAHAIEMGYSIRNAALYATVVSAISVTRAGATPSMPTKEEIDEFIKERKVVFE